MRLPGRGTAHDADVRRELLLLRHAAADQLRATLLATDPMLADPRHLCRFERRAFSQHGEDGILQEIFRRLGIQTGTFVEFGVGDGLENNTALLLAACGWRGAWIEGSPTHVAAIRTHAAAFLADGRLQLREAFIDAANIDALLSAFSLPAVIDLLSIDLDGNDLHVWRAIRCVRPRVVVAEYNAFFPPPVRWTMPYNPAHTYRSDHYYGASLGALADAAASAGLALVGCDLAGVNAFFVDSTLLGDQFVHVNDVARLYQPRRPALSLPLLKRPRLA